MLLEPSNTSYSIVWYFSRGLFHNSFFVIIYKANFRSITYSEKGIKEETPEENFDLKIVENFELVS